jgi:hypothetical protein
MMLETNRLERRPAAGEWRSIKSVHMYRCQIRGTWVGEGVGRGEGMRALLRSQLSVWKMSSSIMIPYTEQTYIVGNPLRILCHTLHPMKECCGLRTISRVPRPTFLNQLPVVVKDTVGTRGGDPPRQFDANLTWILLFPWYFPRDDLTEESLDYRYGERKEHTKNITLPKEWVSLLKVGLSGSPSIPRTSGARHR